MSRQACAGGASFDELPVLPHASQGAHSLAWTRRGDQSREAIAADDQMRRISVHRERRAQGPAARVNARSV